VGKVPVDKDKLYIKHNGEIIAGSMSNIRRALNTSGLEEFFDLNFAIRLCISDWKIFSQKKEFEREGGK